MALRPYQLEAKQQILSAWNSGKINVMAQLATGGGKTVLFTDILAEHVGVAIAIAHRVEIVSQMSLTLAKAGIRHNIIAPKASIREIVGMHVQELQKSFYDPGARKLVAGVDTLIRLPKNTPWFSQVTLVVQDEGHHVLKANKWGFAAALFPNARGLYPTATPVRADGRGLGRQSDGLMDTLVVGVPMRELIKQGYLTEYRIFAPPSDLDLSSVNVTPGGDFSHDKLAKATHRSHIHGDVVEHYLRIAKGKLGVTFAVDVEAATIITQKFKEAGVPAELITAKTPAAYRAHLMQRFRNREILQLVNVDLLGEGVDVPAIEVVSMARGTASFCLFSQQFGRSLRPLPGKTHAIIIDHVGNVMRHGLPDAPRVWSLDRRERKTRAQNDDVIPLKTCLNCMGVYERKYRECTLCGHYSPPAQRSSPAQVDGDLTELDPNVLAALRGEIARIDATVRIPQGKPVHATMAIENRHRARQDAQHKLRSQIALYAGHLKAAGRNDSEIYREFYLTFGVDVATAQTLNAADAGKLTFALIDAVRNI